MARYGLFYPCSQILRCFFINECLSRVGIHEVALWRPCKPDFPCPSPMLPWSTWRTQGPGLVKIHPGRPMWPSQAWGCSKKVVPVIVCLLHSFNSLNRYSLIAIIAINSHHLSLPKISDHFFSSDYLLFECTRSIVN